MITHEQLDELHATISAHYTKSYDELETVTGGGELRSARGNSTEQIVDIVCRYLRETLGLNLESRVGKDDEQTITVRDCTKKHQVDRHVYFNGRLVLIVEVKAYLDACYYTRACNDFKVMRIAHPDVKTVLLSLENGVADDAIVFTDAVFGDVCDKICYLCNGKRSSGKPMYRPEFRKPIEKEGLRSFIEMVCNSAC